MKVKQLEMILSKQRSLLFFYLICLGDRPLNDLNIFLTEEATG